MTEILNVEYEELEDVSPQSEDGELILADLSPSELLWIQQYQENPDNRLVVLKMKNLY